MHVSTSFITNEDRNVIKPSAQGRNNPSYFQFCRMFPVHAAYRVCGRSCVCFVTRCDPTDDSCLRGRCKAQGYILLGDRSNLCDQSLLSHGPACWVLTA